MQRGGFVEVDPRLMLLLKARRVVFAILAVLSTVAALALVYAAFGTTGSGLTPTAALVGIFVLLVFPAMTIWAWAWDRSVRKRVGGAAERQRKAMAVEHTGGRQVRASRVEAKPCRDAKESESISR